MPYSCMSPASLSEEDWVNEILAFSPLDLTQSHDVKSTLQSPIFGPQIQGEVAPDFEDLFSTNSSLCTSASTPGTICETNFQKAQSYNIDEEHPELLDSVSYKLQKLKEDHLLTPKALESVFNTQDVLADTGDWQTEIPKHKYKRLRASHSSSSSCASHDSLSLKNDHHMRRNASTTSLAAKHSVSTKKRNNSKGISTRPNLKQLLSPSSRMSKSFGDTNINKPVLDESITSLFNDMMFFEKPSFSGSWYSSQLPIENDETAIIAAEAMETCFDGGVFTSSGFSEIPAFPSIISDTLPHASDPVPESIFPSIKPN